MPGQHGTSLKDYTEALTTQLRLRRVPGTVFGQIVAEVESHVRETGEDPVVVFGQPGSYSAQYSGGRRPGGRMGWSTLWAGAATTLAVGGALMLLEGVFNRTGVVRITASMLLSWVAMGLMFALVVLRVDDVMADRQTRTVTASRRAPGWAGCLLVAIPCHVGDPRAGPGNPLAVSRGAGAPSAPRRNAPARRSGCYGSVCLGVSQAVRPDRGSARALTS